MQAIHHGIMIEEGVKKHLSFFFIYYVNWNKEIERFQKFLKFLNSFLIKISMFIISYV